MKWKSLPILVCAFLLVSLPTPGQKGSNGGTSHTEGEVRQFFESYAEDLRQHRRDAIADRYDRRGAYMMGNGYKMLQTYDDIRSRYREKWQGPKSFHWIDLSFEILSPTNAVVLGRFEWETAEGKTLKFSYTGVLIKRGGKWFIRVEDESTDK